MVKCHPSMPDSVRIGPAFFLMKLVNLLSSKQAGSMRIGPAFLLLQWLALRTPKGTAKLLTHALAGQARQHENRASLFLVALTACTHAHSLLAA